MVSPERMLEYCELPSEAPEYTDTNVPSDWPSMGHLVVKDMSLTYTGTEKAVLKNLSIDIAGGLKVGVVGRTGAGKSSFIQACVNIMYYLPIDYSVW
jgi:ABC-type multidrug transport system fused ATPase/permease subunit